MARVRSRIILLLFLVLLPIGFFFRVPAPHIALPAERIFTVAGFPIYNTVIASWLTTAVLLVLTLLGRRRLSLVPPGRSLQNVLEVALESLLNLCVGVAGARNGRRFFPLVMTLLLFILFNNWLGLLPGFLTIGPVEPGEHGLVWEEREVAGLRLALAMPGAATVGEGEHEVHLEEGQVVGNLSAIFRGANTTISTPLALAVVAMLFVEFWGIRDLGLFGYGSKFLNLRRLLRFDIANGLIDLFVGFLELVSEVARLISLTFRLFGNMFAGEVLLGVVTFLVPWSLVVIFYGLEMLVGVIQAFIFAMLTLVFATMAVTAHGGEAHGEEH